MSTNYHKHCPYCMGRLVMLFSKTITVFSCKDCGALIDIVYDVRFRGAKQINVDKHHKFYGKRLDLWRFCVSYHSVEG